MKNAQDVSTEVKAKSTTKKSGRKAHEWKGFVGQKCSSVGCGGIATQSKIIIDRRGRKHRKVLCQMCYEGRNNGLCRSKA